MLTGKNVCRVTSLKVRHKYGQIPTILEPTYKMLKIKLSKHYNILLLYSFGTYWNKEGTDLLPGRDEMSRMLIWSREKMAEFED